MKDERDGRDESERCVCQVGRIEAMTPPCMVCPQAISDGCPGEPFPEGCPLAGDRW